MFYKIISIIAVLLLWEIIISNNILANTYEAKLLIIGKSSTTPEHPIIVDPKNQTMELIQVILPPQNRYELFYDTSNNTIIIIKDGAMSNFEIYKINKNNSTLPDPCFSKKYGYYDYFRFSAWSQKVMKLCWTEFIYGNTTHKSKRRLYLSCIEFHKNKPIENQIDLSNYLSNDIGLWAISDGIFIVGYDSDKAAIEGLSPNKKIYINLDNFKIQEIEFPSGKYVIKGQFDATHLALSDGKNIYSHNLHTLDYVGPSPKGLWQIFGMSVDGKGYYAQVLVNRIIYEYLSLALITMKPSHIKKFLFNKEPLGDFRSFSIFSQQINSLKETSP